MPNIKEHLEFDMIMFGAYYGEYIYVHWLLDHGDEDYVGTYGKSHRAFNHNEAAIQYISVFYGPTAGLVARGHIALDTACTNERIRKKGKKIVVKEIEEEES